MTRLTQASHRRGHRKLARLALTVPIALGVYLDVRCAASQTPSIEDLMRQIERLQRRVDELENRQRTAKPQVSRPPKSVAAPTAVPQAPAAMAEAKPAPPAPMPPPETKTAKAAFDTTVPGLMPPEPMGSQFEDALRSDLPGLSIRIPGTDSQVRLYGFAKLSGYADVNGRNQTDAPPPQTIPLSNSAAAAQGGDFGMTARFSRIGVDTRTLTGWGTLETRIEGDFGGGSPTSSNSTFRLRQAWAELGDETFRVLVGQANSLWNEGVFETLIDATNLNQSFVRQAQIRATGRLAPGLTGQVSLEAPETQYTSASGVFTPDTRFNGGASPAFNTAPDLLTRVTYRDDGLVLDMRGLLRRLSVRTAGTGAAPPEMTQNAIGWGLALHARVPMRWLSDQLGPDELAGMVYYGQGIGRYFAGNTSGQDALSTLGLPSAATAFSLNPVPTYGAILAYRRFWLPQLRSNLSYAYARQDYESYALGFSPGSASALGLNRDMQQVFVNLIWSPFAEVRNGVFGSGWLDLGIEYVYTRRDLFGGASAAGSAGAGLGVANRFVAAAVGRF